MMGRSFLLMAVMALALGSNASFALAEQAHENHSGQHIPLLGEEHAPEHAIDSAEMQEDATLHIIDEEHGAAAHGEHAGDEHHSDGLPQFDPSSFPSQIFWLAVVFIMLYIFFSRKTLPEISKVIDTRKEHIQNDLNGAQELKDEAERVKAAYEEALADAREKSSGFFTAVDETIKRRTEKANSGFSHRATKEINATIEAVEHAKADVMDQLDDVAAKVAAEAAEKILGVKADIKKAEKIIQSLQDKKKAA